jgi:hypothetical protein
MAPQYEPMDRACVSRLDVNGYETLLPITQLPPLVQPLVQPLLQPCGSTEYSQSELIRFTFPHFAVRNRRYGLDSGDVNQADHWLRSRLLGLTESELIPAATRSSQTHPLYLYLGAACTANLRKHALSFGEKPLTLSATAAAYSAHCPDTPKGFRESCLVSPGES